MRKMKQVGYGLGLATGVLMLTTGAALAQSVPTAGTTDIATANGPVWTELLAVIIYYVSTYGSLMVEIFGIIAVFVLAILLWKHFAG